MYGGKTKRVAREELKVYNGWRGICEWKKAEEGTGGKISRRVDERMWKIVSIN